MQTILCRSWFDEVWISRGRWWELKLGSTRTELYSTSDDKYPSQNGTNRLIHLLLKSFVFLCRILHRLPQSPQLNPVLLHRPWLF